MGVSTSTIKLSMVLKNVRPTTVKNNNIVFIVKSDALPWGPPVDYGNLSKPAPNQEC